MRKVVIASMAVLGMGSVAHGQVGPPAFVPGQQPHSTSASNILPTPGAGGEVVAPSLPGPGLPADADVDALLRAANDDLAQRRTGAAQEALERAETRLLNRAVLPSQASQPDADPRTVQIGQAREALGRGDLATARQMIGAAIQPKPPRT